MALDPLEGLPLSLLLCSSLSYLAHRKRVLTLDGSLAAFAVGLVIGVFGGITWLLLLLFFLLSSFAATRYRFALKEAMGVQEGIRGERRATNVLANGFAPMAVALLSFAGQPWLPREKSGLIFLSAIAVAGADTLASEIGVLSPKVYLITSFRKVKAGTDGGISVLGELSALAASLYTALFGWVVLYHLSSASGFEVTIPAESVYIIIPIVVGFMGCHLDSLIGATIESRGLVSKRANNLISTSVGAITATFLMYAL